jgi:hypothetical protein
MKKPGIEAGPGAAPVLMEQGQKLKRSTAKVALPRACAF